MANGRQSNSGKFQQKVDTGVLFKNDYKDGPKHPDYRGTASILVPEGMRAGDVFKVDISGWWNETDKGAEYMALKVAEPYEKPANNERGGRSGGGGRDRDSGGGRGERSGGRDNDRGRDSGRDGGRSEGGDRGSSRGPRDDDRGGRDRDRDREPSRERSRNEREPGDDDGGDIPF